MKKIEIPTPEDRDPIQEAQKRYLSTEKGKNAVKRYHSSEKGKEARDRYFQSEKGRRAQLRYDLSEKGELAREKKVALEKLLKEYSKYLETNPKGTLEAFLGIQTEKPQPKTEVVTGRVAKSILRPPLYLNR